MKEITYRERFPGNDFMKETQKHFNIFMKKQLKERFEVHNEQGWCVIEYTWFRYLTGKVVLPEAFALLKIKA